MLAWLPAARPAAARLTATARAVLARRPQAWASAGPTWSADADVGGTGDLERSVG